METWIRPMQFADQGAVSDLLTEGNLSADLQRTSIRLTAWLEGKLVGFCAVEIWGEHASLRGLIVSKDMRKRGIGKVLVAEAVKSSRRFRGVEQVFAYTLFWNIRFYEGCGFKRIAKDSAPPSIKECADFHDPHYKYCSLLRRAD